MENIRFMIVEGALGVGKTSLVELLAKEFNAKKLLEEVENNPFLPKFYKDVRTYAFETQIFFLLSRYRQQQELMQMNLFEGMFISDYMFAKDRIFAYVNLEEDELMLYEKLYAMLKPRIPKPDLLVFLQTSTEILAERIKLRGKVYEKDIKVEYLDKLNRAYNNYFFNYNDSPLLVINTDEINFVQNQNDFKEIVKEIKNLKTGTKYFVQK